MSFVKIFNWYTNIMFESTFFSFLMLAIIVIGLLYYARCKRKFIRWGYCHHTESYELIV